jgi:hypothetical protein
LVSICRAFAKADIGKIHPPGLRVILEQRIDEAIKWQSLKRSKALYRKIEYY